MNLRTLLPHVPVLATACVLLAVLAACIIAQPSFASWPSARMVLMGSAVLGVVAVGMAFVIISGGIDLSVGSMIGLSSILTAILISNGIHPLLAFTLVIALAITVGAIMGALIDAFELPPFLVTLGGMFLFRSLGLLLSEESMRIEHSFYRWLNEASAGAVPPVVIVFFLLVAAGWFVARTTPFGRNTFALGGNEESARLQGVPIARTRISIYALSSACAALGGILTTISLGAGNATYGAMYELDAIAAVVIGGTPLAGGIGSVLGAAAGVLILALIQQLLMLLDVQDSWWVRISIGALLLAFIVLQRLVATRAAWILTRRRRARPD
jgi:simple sugar transport system permease protein